jgi:2-C-methyl-D-erythritol 4-phosphate cytidylyltransferase/2-C-methyl-D-erythritol 2,4-cyclodiphosphate synthase
MGGGTAKQYLLLAGVPVLARTLRTFQESPAIDGILLAVPEGDLPSVQTGIVDRYGFSKVVAVVPGGADRQASVFNALRQAGPEWGIVVVHDGVRPLVSGELICRAVAAARQHGAVAAGIPMRDTVKEVAPAGQVARTLDRQRLWSIQTPQAFARTLLANAYEQAEAAGVRATDDAGLVERLGIPVAMIPGEGRNIKLTTADDLDLAERYLAEPGEAEVWACKGSAEGGKGRMRIGFGFDSHRLAAGRRLVLGGVEIPWEKGLQGHSDADCLIHALCDAILGALGAGDIGSHFPDTDPAYRGISSLTLQERVGQIAAASGYGLVHADCTVVLERPKLAPYRAAMAEKMALALGVPPERISIKAKTNEGMGLVGAGEGAAAFAVATLGQGEHP